MDKIEVNILDHSFNGMPLFLAKLTQRGHLINDMKDLTTLYEDCIDSQPSQALLSLPHDTISRMCTMTVAIVGLSTKAVSQIRTHAKRMTFISTSTQYSSYEGRENNYVLPGGLTIQQECDLFDAYEKVHEAYSHLLDLGVDKDEAGYVLPQGLRKAFIMHGSFPDWRYVLSTRLCHRNTKEVQYIMQMILDKMRKECGNVWANLCLPKCVYGYCQEGKFTCGKKYGGDKT